MNKYRKFSKVNSKQDDELLTWKIQYSKESMRFIVTFSDGTKKQFVDRKNAVAYINDKFFASIL